MLDILMPVGLGNTKVAVQCLKQIRVCTDVPFRVMVLVDGGMPGDYADLEEELHASEHHKWILRHRKEVGYFNACLLDLVQDIQNEWVALIPPEVILDDDKWFGKMQMVFLRDPVAYFVDGQPDTKAKAQPPARRVYDNLARNCRFFLTKRRELNAAIINLPLDSEDPIAMMERKALAQGGTVWCASGVNFYIQTHKEHATCRSCSATPEAPSGSQSSTTPA